MEKSHDLVTSKLNNMKNESLYFKTVDILLDAYNNGHLSQRSWCGCAIGNLIAANMGYEVVYKDTVGLDDKFPLKVFRLKGDKNSLEWGYVFSTNVYNTGEIKEYFFPENYKGEAKIQIDSTGYTLDELRKIERAYEVCERGNSNEEYAYNGLVSVLKTVAEIHEAETPIQAPKRKLELELV